MKFKETIVDKMTVRHPYLGVVLPVKSITIKRNTSSYNNMGGDIFTVDMGAERILHCGHPWGDIMIPVRDSLYVYHNGKLVWRKAKPVKPPTKRQREIEMKKQKKYEMKI